MIDKFFLATKAFIVHNGKVLIIREASTNPDGTNAGKYDVPGGRLIPGETVVEALTREVTEETGLDVDIGDPITHGEWRPTVRGEAWQIIACFFHCTATTDDVTLSEEHDAYAWIDPHEFRDYPIMENLIPVFETYLSHQNS